MDVTALGRLLAADGAEPTLAREAPAARARRRRRPAAGTPATPDRERYTVVPSLASPRLLVPAGARRHAAAAAAAASHAISWRAWVRKRATRACFAAGVGDLVFRDRLLPGSPATLARHLSEVLDQPVRVGLRLGPPRANQKPVLVLLDEAAEVVGYAKLAVDPLTRSLLRTERAALAELAAARPATLRVPQVRHAGRWGEADLLVLSALPVRHARSAATARAAPVVTAAAAEAARLRPTTVAALAGSAYLAGCAARVAQLPDDRHRALLTGTLDRAAAGDPPLAFGCWHGDFFAGNLAVRGGQLLAWDWERFAGGVPLGFDALHYAFMSALLVRRRPLPVAAGRTVLAAAQLLAPFGVPPAYAGVVAALYLVEIATRYRRDRNHAVAGGLPCPADWLPPALPRLEPAHRAGPDAEVRRA